ncbi:hypothetical protein DL764_005923 [Monosporascus ibericus]|uniref:Uncharacterized protein n=1 Tax=Monosporascus ibericus TaxID=155417 RepID=A0A4Q4T8W7_9PEZI|nr:hypothetical protein DL764_005923 [Monosporascus ibericus]
MISTVPYDNLSLHYNPTHSISIDPQHLFQKMVANKRGRGGYSMEIAILYNHMLVGLGFDAYTVGVRTRPRIQGVPEGDFPGWVHIVTFPDGSKYHVDVGFGGDGATLPLPLIEELAHRNLGTQEIRLVRDWMPTQRKRTEEAKLWIYQYRNSPESAWNSFYAFAELEFTQADFEVINWWTSHNPGFYQALTMLLIKFLRREGENGQQEICGKLVLVNGLVKENLSARTRLVQECKTEERIEALDKYFGIRLTEEERLGIRGWATGLPQRESAV